MSLKNNAKPLFLLAALLGYSYILLLPFHPYAFSYLLKASPVLIIAALALWGQDDRLSGYEKKLLVVAMLGSASGDIFLDFDRALYLKQALGSFLITQIAFFLMFWPKRDWNTPKKYLIPVISLMGCGLVYLFSQTAGALFIPVVVYVIVLSAMAFSALLVPNNPWVNVGGILFLIADALIGVNRFIMPFEYSTHVIVTIYLTSQLCIAWGLLFYRELTNENLNTAA